MHLHMHLADCVQDYGPVYSFWLFSFERYNGILGKYPTNNKSIALQMMRKFARDRDLDDLGFPAEYQVQIEPLISKVRDNIVQVVSTDCEKLLSLFTLANDQIDVTNELWYTVDYHSFAPPHVSAALTTMTFISDRCIICSFRECLTPLFRVLTINMHHLNVQVRGLAPVFHD